MTVRRVLGFVLVVVLVVTPFVGFAAGDAAASTWDTHPRHPAGQHGAPHVAWKTMPAAAVATPETLGLALADRITVEEKSSPASLLPREPFVPPRA